MNRAGLACAGALAVLCAAGCGGGGGSDTYTLSATQSCLKKAGFQTTAVANPYLRGEGGNLRVHLTNREPGLLAPNQPNRRTEPGYVFLVFGKDPAAARAVEGKALTLAMQTFQHAAAQITRAALRKGVGLTGNVFYYSATGALTRRERAGVLSCLR